MITIYMIGLLFKTDRNGPHS